MNKKKIIEAIKALHGEAAANIETETVCKNTPDLVMAAIDEFGSLGNAVRKAELEFFFEFEFNGVRLRTGRVEVARGLLDWAEMHGPISSKALKNTAPELLQVINKLFGNVPRISARIGLIMAPGEDVVVEEGEKAAKEDVVVEKSKKAVKAAKGSKESTVIEVVPPVDDEPEAKLIPIEPATAGGTIDCQICGKTFKRLGLHLSRTHGIGLEEYQRGEF